MHPAARRRFSSWWRPASPSGGGSWSGPCPGNTLSWVYTFEWPFFAGYAIYMWWKLLHEGSRGGASVHGVGRRQTLREASIKDEEEKLAEYNRYLAELHASDQARRN